MSTERAVDGRGRQEVWLMLAAGTLTSAAEAWLMGWKLWTPLRHMVGARFWGMALVWSVVCVGVSVSGGAIAAWVTGRLVSGAPAGDANRVWRKAAVGWAFLPCLMVMAQRGWWWTLPLAALATGATAFRLRPLFREALEKPRAESAVEAMRSLDGLPPMGAPPLRSFLVAAAVQMCVLSAMHGAMGWASVALSGCVAMLIGWWTAWDGRWARLWAGDRTAMRLGGAAVVLLMLVLTRWGGGGTGMRTAAAGARAGGKPARGPQTDQAGSDYVGIILWPPPKKKVEIVPPRSNALQGQGVGSKPLVIPFDGPYWYFKAPMMAPGPKAHVMFGKSTEAKVQSTNWMPLRMEAHQNLGLPIDLDCCREIDVTVTNADIGAGRIDVSLVLSDTDSPTGRSIQLGDRPVMSSDSARGPGAEQNKAAVTETLKFAVPLARARPGTVRQFNEINVIFQPSAARAWMGSKIAVEEFELVPR